MKIRVKAGSSTCLSTHVGKGEGRKALFIAPWGASVGQPIQAPAGADLSSRQYELSVSGEAEKLIKQGLSEKHSGISRVEEVK